MSDFLIFLILVLEVVVLAASDRRIFDSWLTPFNLLAVPFVAILTLVLVFGEAAGLYAFNYGSLFVWIVGLSVFWIFGSLPVHLLFGSSIKDHSGEPFPAESMRHGYLVALSVFCILASAYGLITAMSYSDLSVLATEEFKETYSSGWQAHARVVSYSLLMFFVGTKAYRKKTILLLLLLMYGLIAVGTGKSWMMIPLSSGIAYQVATRKTTIEIRRLFRLVVVFFLIFSLAYVIRFAAADAESVVHSELYAFLIRHFFLYLSSGIMGLSERYDSGMSLAGVDWHAVFAPIINLGSFATGSELVSQLIEDWTDTGAESASNVYTVFGELYGALGAVGAIVYVSFMALTVNLLYAMALIRRSTWLLLAVLFIACMLAFGWFSNYSGNLMSIEVPVWTILLMWVPGTPVRVWRDQGKRC